MLLPKHTACIISFQSRGKKSKKIIIQPCLSLPNDGKWSNVSICCSFWLWDISCSAEDLQVTLAIKRQWLCQWKLPASQTSPVALQMEPPFSGQICGNHILYLISFLPIWSLGADLFMRSVNVVTLLAFLSAQPAARGQFCLDKHLEVFLFAVVVLGEAPQVSNVQNLCSFQPVTFFCHVFHCIYPISCCFPSWELNSTLGRRC